MKTSTSKNKLTEALRSLPGDFALSTTRQHIVNALKSIQKYEERYSNKKSNNLDLHQQWWDGIVANTVKEPMASHTRESVAQSLNYLDSLIEAEKKILENIKLEKEKKDNPDDIILS